MNIKYILEAKVTTDISTISTLNIDIAVFENYPNEQEILDAVSKWLENNKTTRLTINYVQIQKRYYVGGLV